MKICIIGGGGAIGGYLAVLLANSGNEVTVMARGATLRAIEERGLALISDEHPEPIIAKVRRLRIFVVCLSRTSSFWQSKHTKWSRSLMILYRS